MFSLGEAYDVFMGRWSARLAPLLVRFAGVIDGDDVLDVGSGTGELTASVAAAAQSSRIVGIDQSEPYVAVARARHQLSQRMRFEIGDAQQLPFEDASFDRTLSLLILNFVPNPRKALAEMIRVTRPGGTIAAAVWDYGEGMEMLRVFGDEVIAHWNPFLQQQGPAGAYVATLSERDREQLRLNLRRRFLGDDADRPITLGARAWAVRGVVPPRSAAPG